MESLLNSKKQIQFSIPVFAIVCGILISMLVITAHADAERFDQEENILWKLIKEYRQENNVQAVGLNDNLMSAAEWMSENMATNDYCSHTDSLGRDPFQRMADFGYGYNTWKGENIVCGVNTAQAAFDLFKGSSKHNEVMLHPNFKVIGIARAYDEDSGYGWYWTVDFGGQGSPTEPTPIPTPISVPPTGPYESPHGAETPRLIPPASTPAALPKMGG